VSPVTAYTGTQTEIIFANGFAYPAAAASSSAAQSLLAGASGEYQQPVYWGGFWQQGRSNQVSTVDFVISLSGEGSATTATFIAGLNTSAGTITGGKTLLTFPALTCTSFSSATVKGRLLIQNWGSGYGTSSVATNLQTSGDFTYTNSGTGGALAAGPTALQTTDFSVNQWLYLSVTFSTSSTSNSATLQALVVRGDN
jgi:hypothetical protein